MITIKLPYKSDYNIIDLMRQYTILVKSCYNRLLKGYSDKEIRLYLKSLNNINDLDSRFIENAIIDSKAIQKENKVIFNRFNFIKRLKDKISKDEFKENKHLPIVNYGETQQHGNRKFKLDLNNNKIIFKLNKNNHIDINLPKLKQNYKKELQRIQLLMELNELKVSFKLDKKHIYISYEPIKSENKIELKDNRIMGLDLNPNNIGISILEFDGNDYKVIYNSFIDLYENNKLYKNKKDYNLIMISKQIIQLMKSYHVKNISLEDLTMKSKNHNKGKKYNKLCNNDWNRNLFVNNLIKRCGIEGINVYNINPAYTSVIGNLKYDYCDPVNASIEVARRGYQFNKMYIKNSFYPEFSLKNQWNQWKKDIDLFTEDWKNFYKHLKTLNMKYRVPINQLVYKKLCVKNIMFYSI
jgi:IS605 OrfB family transposase